MEGLWIQTPTQNIVLTSLALCTTREGIKIYRNRTAVQVAYTPCSPKFSQTEEKNSVPGAGYFRQ